MRQWNQDVQAEQKTTSAQSLQLQAHAEIKRKPILCCNLPPAPRCAGLHENLHLLNLPLHLVCDTHIPFSVETAKMEEKLSSHISLNGRSEMKAALPQIRLF